MTQEDKDLLLRDLSARLPYGVMVLHQNEYGREVTTKLSGYNGDWYNYYIDNLCYHLKLHEFKPYLRPMSSMTEDEMVEFKWLNGKCDEMPTFDYIPVEHYRLFDWLNRHHFDYRNLIEKSLAIEVTEENNPYKE